MSLHRNEFLVSSHQAELARQAADIRLARIAAAHSRTGSDNKGARRMPRFAGLVAAIRPVRRAAADVVKLPAATSSAQTTAAGGSHS